MNAVALVFVTVVFGLAAAQVLDRFASDRQFGDVPACAALDYQGGPYEGQFRQCLDDRREARR